MQHKHKGGEEMLPSSARFRDKGTKQLRFEAHEHISAVLLIFFKFFSPHHSSPPPPVPTLSSPSLLRLYFVLKQHDP